MVIKDKFGLDEHADVTEKLIPSMIEEETNLLNADGIYQHYRITIWYVIGR